LGWRGFGFFCNNSKHKDQLLSSSLGHVVELATIRHSGSSEAASRNKPTARKNREQELIFIFGRGARCSNDLDYCLAEQLFAAFRLLRPTRLLKQLA
jgi:hypothetical protein